MVNSLIRNPINLKNLLDRFQLEMRIEELKRKPELTDLEKIELANLIRQRDVTRINGLF